MTTNEYKNLVKKPSKCRNKKVATSEGVFDSKKEFRRWEDLKLLAAAGEISDLKRQVRFEVIPSQYDPKTKKVIERNCCYFADFTYLQDGELIVEDVKGDPKRKPDYIIKRKLMLLVHGISVKET